MAETTCPVCQSSRYKLLFSDINKREALNCSGTYVECRECSLIYLKDIPSWNEIVKLYSHLDQQQKANANQLDGTEERKQTETSSPKWQKILRKIRFRPHSWPTKPVSQPSKRLLDLGCSSGAKLLEFAHRGYEIWGVDLSADAIAKGQKLLPQGHFFVGELKEVQLPSAHFDYIRIDNVLEHVPNPKEVVKECYRLLAKGGQLMLYVPHGRSLSMRLMKGNSISSWIPFHLQLFTRKSLTKLLKEAGFSCINIYGYYPSSWLPLSIMQLKNKKQLTLKYDYPLLLKIICYPIGWLAAILGYGEELVAIGNKES